MHRSDKLCILAFPFLRSSLDLAGSQDFSFVDVLLYHQDMDDKLDKYVIKFASLPPIFPDKVDIGGVLTIESTGPETCRQTLQGDVNVDVFGFKSAVEHLVIKSLTNTYKQLTSVVDSWTGERLRFSEEDRKPQMEPIKVPTAAAIVPKAPGIIGRSQVPPKATVSDGSLSERKRRSSSVSAAPERILEEPPVEASDPATPEVKIPRGSSKTAKDDAARDPSRSPGSMGRFRGAGPPPTPPVASPMVCKTPVGYGSLSLLPDRMSTRFQPLESADAGARADGGTESPTGSWCTAISSVQHSFDFSDISSTSRAHDNRAFVRSSFDEDRAIVSRQSSRTKLYDSLLYQVAAELSDATVTTKPPTQDKHTSRDVLFASSPRLSNASTTSYATVTSSWPHMPAGLGQVEDSIRPGGDASGVPSDRYDDEQSFFTPQARSFKDYPFPSFSRANSFAGGNKRGDQPTPVAPVLAHAGGAPRTPAALDMEDTELCGDMDAFVLDSDTVLHEERRNSDSDDSMRSEGTELPVHVQAIALDLMPRKMGPKWDRLNESGRPTKKDGMRVQKSPSSTSSSSSSSRSSTASFFGNLCRSVGMKRRSSPRQSPTLSPQPSPRGRKPKHPSASAKVVVSTKPSIRVSCFGAGKKRSKHTALGDIEE
eukprot:jgi/Mesvir1/20877/Mv07956-RA.1